MLHMTRAGDEAIKAIEAIAEKNQQHESFGLSMRLIVPAPSPKSQVLAKQMSINDGPTAL